MTTDQHVQGEPQIIRVWARPSVRHMHHSSCKCGVMPACISADASSASHLKHVPHIDR